MDKLTRFLLIALTALPFLGCTKTTPTGTVKGTVQVKGKPYTEAAVMIVSLATGHGGTAEIDAQGNYELKTPVPTGEYSVYFAPKEIPAAAATAAPLPMVQDKKIPDKYWDEAGTDLKVTIKEGVTEFPIDIK